MGMKKGVFFTIDSIIAGAIIIFVIIFASSLYAKGQPSFHLNYISQDIVKTLSTITIGEIDNEYVNERIANGDITNLNNTIIRQIGEFWAEGTADGMEYANKTVQNVTDPFVSNITGFGLWINNETIYKRDFPIKQSLVSSKKILSGVEKGKSPGLTRQNPPTLLGPVIVEVRVWQ